MDLKEYQASFFLRLYAFLAPIPIPAAINKLIPPSMGQAGSSGSQPGSIWAKHSIGAVMRAVIMQRVYNFFLRLFILVFKLKEYTKLRVVFRYFFNKRLLFVIIFHKNVNNGCLKPWHPLLIYFIQQRLISL